MLTAVAATLWRLSPVLLLLALLLLGEWRWPWRKAQPRRWLANLALGGLSSLVIGLLPLASMTAAAHWAAAHQFGLLRLLPLPNWLAIALSLLLLDLAIYIQHRALHTQPWLWRLHRVHHTDPMLDFSSGLRFHPLEALASALYKSAVVALLGAPPAVAAAFALLLLAASLFNHANVRLPEGFERALRPWLVTPPLHRIHHSAVPGEVQRNYGTLLSVWDRLFGSALAVSAAGNAMVMGLPDQPEQTNFTKMLADPLQAPRVQ